MPDLIQELKRRNVFRAAVAYLAVSWLIVEVATTILPLYPEAPAWLARSIVTVLFIGFIPTLFVSWAYELTSKGLRREQPGESDSGSRLRLNRLADFVTGGAVVAAIALFLWSPQSSSRVPSVAVLPFANMSASAENEYFSDGLTETLIHMIAQSPAIKVTSRTSVFALKGEDIDVREIGSMLGVAHVLEGSVQRSGDQLRITAQLIDTADGSHIWSKNYDRSAADIFAIQDEIAGVVSNALKTSLLAKPDAIPGVGTENTQAYDLYLHAVADRVTGTIDALNDAEQSLKQALAIDPEFHTAKAELAAVYYQQWWFGFRSQEDAVPDILALTEQVLASKGFDSHALGLKLAVESDLAMLDGRQDDLAAVVEKLRELVERAPNSVDVRMFLAEGLARMNDVKGYLAQLRQATVIDPLRADLYWRMVGAQKDLGDIEGAVASAHHSLELNPEQVLPYVALADLRRDDGDTVGYLENYHKAWQQDPGDVELVIPLAIRLYVFRMIPEGDVYLQHAKAIAPNHGAVHMAELVRAGVARDDEAVIQAAKVLIEEFEGGNRIRGWIFAARLILWAGLRQGSGEEQLAYLQQFAPDIANPDADTVPLHVRLAQGYAVGELAQLLPHGDMLALLEDLDEFYETMADGARAANVRYFIDSLIIRGDAEAAVEIYLSDVATLHPSKRTNEDWFLENPIRAELLADPRVQAALERSRIEDEAIREEIRQFLATQDALSFEE